MPTPKIEAEQERVQAKFAEFKAGAKSLATDVRIEHARQVDDLEQRMNATKVKLKELSEADERISESNSKSMWRICEAHYNQRLKTPTHI